MRSFAWVGGSIWGVELGGLVSVVLGFIILHGNWSRERTEPLVVANPPITS